MKKHLRIVILILMLILGIGFAFLADQIGMRFDASLFGNKWGIQLETLYVYEDNTVVANPEVTISEDMKNVTFGVALSRMGDKFEFEVDAHNIGTVNAMIKSIELQGMTEELSQYMTCEITYADGTEVKEKDLLRAGSIDTINLKLVFRDDIDPMSTLGLELTSSFNLNIEYTQADETAVERNKSLYELMKSQVSDNDTYDYNNVSYSTLNNINMPNKNGQGTNLLKGTEKDKFPIYYNRGLVDNSYVIFADMCWKIVRTTDTGGTKLLLNNTANGCINKNSGNIGRSAFNNTGKYGVFGYMYGDISTENNIEEIEADCLFGNNVEWDGEKYTLTDPIEVLSTDENYYEKIFKAHKYTCSNMTDECEKVKYYGSISDDRKYAEYFILENGKKIEDIIKSANENSHDSTIKTKVDSWYKALLLKHERKIEDTVYCNSRRMNSNHPLNPNGLAITSNNKPEKSSLFYDTTEFVPSLDCDKNDAFTVSDEIGNGALTYPIGLMTIDELSLAGYVKSGNPSNNCTYLTNSLAVIDGYYWTMTPYNYYVPNGSDRRSSAYLYLGCSIITSLVEYDNYSGSSSYYIKPVISVKQSLRISSGTGKVNDPYILK